MSYATLNINPSRLFTFLINSETTKAGSVSERITSFINSNTVDFAYDLATTPCVDELRAGSPSSDKYKHIRFIISLLVVALLIIVRYLLSILP